MNIGPTEYLNLPLDPLPDGLYINDHLNGFDINGHNDILCCFNESAKKQNRTYSITYHQIIDKQLLIDQYPNLQVNFSASFQKKMNFSHFANYNVHPQLTFKNFLCSFNGSSHVSRKLLASTIKKFNWWNSEYCSKNFVCTLDNLLGHVVDYVGKNEDFYCKFFDTSQEFLNTVYSFGHNRFAHNKNIYTLETKLTDSFIHVNSETMATSYQPFVTEKFLYSIVTRGLFLSYAQPGWHAHIDKYYGFKLYTKLFDYRFDSIENPVERLVELMTMISKFSNLSSDDWRDLYLLEQDTIEYNYDHYFSGGYLKCLKQHE